MDDGSVSRVEEADEGPVLSRERQIGGRHGYR